MTAVATRYVVELPEDVALSMSADAERYRWIRRHGSCPFAETDSAWDTPDALDKAIDECVRLESDFRKAEKRW